MAKIADDLSMSQDMSLRATRRGRLKDTLISEFIRLNGAIAIVAIALIFIFLLMFSLPVFRHTSVAKFILGKTWQPEFEVFGILPLLAGSFFVTLGAIAIAVPAGIASAIYIAEIAPKRIAVVLKTTVEVLAGIPSVVIGFIGLTVASPFIAYVLKLPTGVCALTGSVMLAFMSVPTIISIAEDAIAAVPRAHRDGSLALGANRWETIRGVIVPSARSGITAACMLGVGRAVGETMTVLMVCGQAGVLPAAQGPGIGGILKGCLAFFTGPVRTMTGTIAGDMGEIVEGSLHYQTLFAVGLTLFVITFAINLIADIALRRSRQ